MRAPLCLVLPTAILGATAAGHCQGPRFSDQTAQAGITAVHSPSYSAGFAAGGAVGDFDRDGYQDVFVASGGNQPDRLYINDRDGTFTERGTEWGIALRHRSTGACVGDFDGDGFLDLFVTSLGPSGNDAPGYHKLYRNDGGHRFVDVASAMGVASTGANPDGWGGAFGDYDLDGDLDLAVCGWRNGATNRLFRNDGATFTDVTVSSGIAPSLVGMNGFAAKFADMDGDLDPELIWIGDFGTSKYFRNEGNGRFTDVTTASGTANDGTEMGITVADVNEDGRLDFYVTTIGTNNLYVNQGNNVFTNIATAAGVTNTQWGWGTVAVDLDHDTLQDLVATTQSGRQFAFHNRSVNPASPQFAEIATTSGLVSNVSGRGLSNIDYDNDGDQDIVIFPSSGPIKLFRNDSNVAGAHWLRVFLDAGCSLGNAPDGVGAIVEATVGNRTWIRLIDAGSNYLSNSELSAHFGLGSAATVDTLRVRWPGGQVTTLSQVAVDRTIVVRAPSTQPCAHSIGAGCATSSGHPTLALQTGTTPSLGSSFGLDVTGFGAGGSGALLFAFNRATPALDLAVLGLRGCALHLTGPLAASIALTPLGGVASVGLQLGSDPTLADVAVYVQAVVADPNLTSPIQIGLSNALRLVVN